MTLLKKLNFKNTILTNSIQKLNYKNIILQMTYYYKNYKKITNNNHKNIQMACYGKKTFVTKKIILLMSYYYKNISYN